MPPSPLELIRLLAQRTERLVPSQLSRPQQTEFRDLSRKVFVPQHDRASRAEAQWSEKAAQAVSEEQRAKFLKAMQDAEYRKARLAKMDQAAMSIANAKGTYDDDLRAFVQPGEGGVPSGIATFYPPGHYAGDALADQAAYLELLGAMPDAQGTGRVLLRHVGLDSYADPLMWHSTTYPETLGFYKSRGAELIPKSEIPKDSLLYGNLPVFRVPRGDMIKEKKGGLVRMKEHRCG